MIATILFILTLAAYTVAAWQPVQAEEPQFKQGKFLVIKGQPRLIIGCYEMPKDDAVLKQLADSGFNLVCCHTRADLDRAQKHGLYGWVPIGAGYGPDKPQQQKRLGDQIRGLKDHPALLVWELPKELEGKTLYHLECDETNVVKDGRFDDGTRPYDVHVY